MTFIIIIKHIIIIMFIIISITIMATIPIIIIKYTHMELIMIITIV